MYQTLKILHYCLNLDRRPDRRIQAGHQFRKAGIEVQRISAPDAAGIDEARGWRNKGARACALGHRLCWRAARKAGAEAALVFEDDVVLCRDFRERFESLELPEDWMIFYFGCTFRDVPEPIGPGLVRVRGRTWATHAMMVRRELFSELHRHLAPQSRRKNRPPVSGWAEAAALDNLLCDFHLKYPVYAAYPFLAWQMPGNSSIDDRQQMAWSREGRQLWCPEIVAELDRRVGSKAASNPAQGLTGVLARGVQRQNAAPPPPLRDGPAGQTGGRSHRAAQIRRAGAGGSLFPADPIPLTRGRKLADLPLYCINLNRRPDRKIRAWGQFRRHGLAVQRIAGPDAFAVHETRGWECTGYRACAAGHRMAWRRARKAGAAAAIVMEDDVVLCPDFGDRFRQLELPDDWGVFFFGCCFEPPGPEMLPNGLLKVRGGTFDNHAYAIRAELWPELSAVFRKLSARKGEWSLPVTAVNDRILSEWHKRCAFYSVWPPMAWQATGLSNNQNIINGNTDCCGRQIPFPEAVAHLPWQRKNGRREAAHSPAKGIDESRIAFFTTSLRTDVQELQSACLEQHFPASTRVLMDEKTSWPASWFHWLEVAAVDAEHFDWFIHIDEDCFVLEKEPLLRLLEQMNENGCQIAGPPDAWHHYRNYNPMALNSFFMACSREVVLAWQKRTHIPRFRREWIEEIPWPEPKLNPGVFDTEADPMTWKSGAVEPYYGFFWVLKEAGIRFRYLPVGFVQELAVSTLLDSSIWHAWYLRERHSDKQLDSHGCPNRERYDRILQQVRWRLLGE